MKRHTQNVVVAEGIYNEHLKDVQREMAARFGIGLLERGNLQLTCRQLAVNSTASDVPNVELSIECFMITPNEINGIRSLLSEMEQTAPDNMQSSISLLRGFLNV